jgi:hypothetical protein
VCTGIDADIVMKVTSLPVSSEACDGILAGATAFLVERVTLRPIYGLILLCAVSEADFDNNLATTVHEVLHALVLFSSSSISRFHCRFHSVTVCHCACALHSSIHIDIG